MKNNHPIGQPTPILPRRRQTDEEKLERTLEMLIERSNNKVLGEMRALNRNLERAVTRLLQNVEGVASGEKDVAIAGVVDGEQDDLPRLARVKADPTLLYTLKTGAIAKRVGLSTMRVSFLLNKTGLNWVTRKPELWSNDMYGISGTRLWHPKTVKLLRDVLDDPKHSDRKNATAACKRFFAELDANRAK